MSVEILNICLIADKIKPAAKPKTTTRWSYFQGSAIRESGS